MPYLFSGFLGFTISVVVNYLLSMKYVFVRRDDLSRTKEFTIFVILSAFGLLINELVLYICLVYTRSRLWQSLVQPALS